MTTRHIPVWPALLMVAFALTFATILVKNWEGGYGFPLAWKNGGCPPPGIVLTESCLSAIGFDWLGFGLDILSYTAIGYMILIVYATRQARKRTSLRV